jgi:hypothetical protein
MRSRSKLGADVVSKLKVNYYGGSKCPLQPHVVQIRSMDHILNCRRWIETEIVIGVLSTKTRKSFWLRV